MLLRGGAMASRSIARVASIVVVAALLATPVYAASAKPGGTCPKVGAVTTINKVRYVCANVPTWVKKKTTATKTPTAAPTLSEQPNKAKYAEFFGDIYLGKMAIGKKIGTDGFPTRTNIFTLGVDQFCTMMTLKKMLPAGTFAGAIYDTATKTYTEPKSSFPMELKAGGSGGCGSLVQSLGKYEDKLYVDDVLIAVMPFEVK
jgi:hypothetical protein